MQITDYFDGLLQNAEAHSPYVYLEAYARSYAALLPLAEAVVHAAPHVALPDAQAVLGTVWAVHLDAYLAAEATWVQGMLDDLCQKWQRNVRRPTDAAGECRAGTPRGKHTAGDAARRREALVLVQV